MKSAIYVITLALAILIPAMCSAAEPVPTLDDVEMSIAVYDLEKASSQLQAYKKARTREQAANDRINISTIPGAPDVDKVDLLQGRISLISDMLDRVEQLQVIDSISVDRDTFFSSYRIASPTGRLLPASSPELPPLTIEGTGIQAADPAFVTESGDMVLWTGYEDNDSSDVQHCAIYQTDRLADGRWDTAVKLFDRNAIFNDNTIGQVYSPFLMNDGITVYFAADGPQSIGGLDIFIARRDGDHYLQPANIGMPYNSPGNDFMLVIDEETGLGWWATDRNAPDDRVNIYVFVPSELRINYPADTPDLASKALISSFADTPRKPDTDYQKLLSQLNNLSHPTAPVASFEFPLPDGTVNTRITDFNSPDSRLLISEWLDSSKKLAQDEAQLAKLRSIYAQGDHSVADDILALEKSIPVSKKSLRHIANTIITLETK